MRRYLSNPFSHSLHTHDAQESQPTSDVTAARPSSSNFSLATPDVSANNAQTPDVNPPTFSAADMNPPNTSTSILSPNSTQTSTSQQSRTSYLPSVPSIPIAIPSVRKYLFSNSGTSPSPPASPHSSSGHHHHFPHLPNRPHLRRHNSVDSNDNPGASTSRVSNFTDMLSASLAELSTLVDKSFGPVGQLKDFVARRAHNDRLVAILDSSEQDRNRLLAQFLRARHFNATDAMHMLSNALRWRNVVNIENYFKDTTKNMCLPSACFPMTVVSDPDQSKQPVIYGLIRLLDKKQAERTAFQNALISFLESCYFGDTYAVDEMAVILDFRDWSIRRNAPYRLVKDGIQTLQDYYPERLARVFILNYPTTIRAAYTVISPIIDAGAKEKIVWIPDTDPSTTLLKYLPPTSIPTFLGGQLNARLPSSWPDVEAEFAKVRATQSSYAHSIFH